MNGPPSGRYPTQTEQPRRREPVSCPVVRVTLPGPGAGAAGDAVVESRDGKVRMSPGPGMLSKRFRPGELVAYFKSELYEDGILEIGDRVPAEKW